MKLHRTIAYFALCILMLSCAMTHSLQRSTPTADIHLPGQRACRNARSRRRRACRDADAPGLHERRPRQRLSGRGRTRLHGRSHDQRRKHSDGLYRRKSKTVAERNGEIAIDFIVGIPAALQSSTWGLSLTPVIENNGTEEALQPLSIRGELFSDIQKRQYWQMNKYLNRILDDSTELTTTTSLAAKYYEAYNRYVAGGQKRRPTNWSPPTNKRISFPYLNEPEARLRTDPQGRDTLLLHPDLSADEGYEAPAPLFPRSRRCHRPQPLRPHEQRYADLHRDIHVVAFG